MDCGAGPDSIKGAKRMLERQEEQVWDILDEVIHEHPVLLNRAPTLHKLSILAFKPVLIDGDGLTALADDLSVLEQRFDGRYFCLLYTSPSPRDLSTSRMPSSA